MASFKYLFTNRAKFRLFSKAFFFAWAKRLLTFPELIRRNYRRWKLINAGATIDDTAEIGLVNIGGDKQKLSVGGATFLGRVEIALHDKVSIGNYVCINDGAAILTASHDIADPLWQHIKSPIVIDDYAWIATNSIILPGVHIGRGAVVGAGAVVSKNVQPYEVVAGNPARPINKSRTTDLRYNPCSFLAANLAWLKG